MTTSAPELTREQLAQFEVLLRLFRRRRESLRILAVVNGFVLSSSPEEATMTDSEILAARVREELRLTELYEKKLREWMEVASDISNRVH